MRVGAAKIDITPEEPVRLCGYAGRTELNEGVEQPIVAGALAFQPTDQPPALLLSVEVTAIPDALTERLAQRLAERAGVPRERFVLTCTHTHAAPCVTGALPNMFGRAIPEEHVEGIERYTRMLFERLEQVALSALARMEPGTLSCGEGRATFGANRRTEGGPADPALPVLVARNRNGKPLAIVANYACHCTTLREFNRIHGDWAGEARERIEAMYPGSVAMITLGFAGDINPTPRGQLEHAREYGQQVATEVERLLADGTGPLRNAPVCGITRIALPFESIPDRAEWERRAKEEGAVGYHASQFLALLDRGETIPEALSYPVQVWSFGRDLTMVFLAGEVVIDYAVRLKAEHPDHRLWLTAYANDVPCYIPSVRLLREGGYEPDSSNLYYGQPAGLAECVEEKVIGAVHALIEAADARVAT
jgi:hypothetical protein